MPSRVTVRSVRPSWTGAVASMDCLLQVVDTAIGPSHPADPWAPPSTDASGQFASRVGLSLRTGRLAAHGVGLGRFCAGAGRLRRLWAYAAVLHRLQHGPEEDQHRGSVEGAADPVQLEADEGADQHQRRSDAYRAA